MNKIIIDGKEYELSAELVEKIKAEVTAQEKAENPFERNVDELYYFIVACGVVGEFIDTKSGTDNALYSAGNYCRDKAIMEQRALHEMLNRRLWRYSETHGGDAPWDGSQAHFYICWEMDSEFCTCTMCRHKDQGTVYFRKVETAQAAIEEVVKPFMAAHPEFVW